MTDKGSRNNLANRLNYRLSGDEKIRILSSTPVSGTRWHAVDMYEKDIFVNFKLSLIKEYIIIYLVFSLIALYMRSILLKVDVKRTNAETNLKQSHGQIKELNKKLEFLSRVDSLTNLYNRRFFDETMDKEWNRVLRTGHSLTCVLIDVDFFKQYNDHYGHQAGDECLKTLSNLMNDVFRRAGDIVARYGGEEFIVAMSNVSAEDSENTVKQFQQALESLAIPHKYSAISEYITVSAGLVNLVPSQDNSIDDMIEQADKALYKAKANGRNCIVVCK